MDTPSRHTSDETFLVELRSSDVLILIDLVGKALRRNSDVRIQAAYMGILERIESNVRGQLD